MKNIVLISCASKKLNNKAKAKDLYISPLFKLNLSYAQSLNPDNIFILSAEHGLLNLDDEISPYNKTLNKMSNDEIEKWSVNVKEQLNKVIDMNNDKVIFLAREKYRRYLMPYIKNYEVPLQGLGIGKQLRYLKERLK